MVVRVEVRGAHDSLLHQVVGRALPLLRARMEEQDRSLPPFVWRELEAFVDCGDPARGFAWLVCDCGFHRLVPFSCKGRGFCPACIGRRMAERAARWVDELLPAVPVRQWVLTVPWAHRWHLARCPELLREVDQVLVRTVSAWLASRSGLGKLGQSGAISVTQRFGSALNLNVHLHVLVLDGVYDPHGSFVRVSPPTTEEVAQLLARIRARVERRFAARGLTSADEADDTEDVLARVHADAVAGRGARRHRGPRSSSRRLPPRCAALEGYTLHAGVGIGAADREGLERLCRYVCRPPLPEARLARTDDDRLLLTLKRPWDDGTTGFTFEPVDLVQRLAALVPPPSAHQVVYHGVFAPRSKRRALVTARARGPPPVRDRKVRVKPTPLSAWAELLLRVFGADGFACPVCHHRLRLRALVLSPRPAGRILAGLARSAARAPPP